MNHVRIALNMVQWRKPYLMLTKLHDMQLALKYLRSAIDDQGEQMDLDRSESDWVHYWKMPANPSQDVISSATYLIYVIANDHILMELLTLLAWNTPFELEWSKSSHDTRQPAFKKVEDLVRRMIKYRRVPPNHSKVIVETVWTTTDDVAPVVVQRTVWKKATISVLSSAELINARTYAMPEMKTLTSIGKMSRCLDILLGTQWSWLLDHKRMMHLLNQRDLPDFRPQWLRKIILFEFCISYIERSQKSVANTLLSSRLYSTHSIKTDRVRVDMFYHNVVIDGTVDSALAGGDLVAKIWVPADIREYHG